MINGDPIWAELLSLTNIALFSIVGYISWRQVRRQKGGGWFRVLLALLGTIGFYWAAIYLYVFITPANASTSVAFGQIFVRPMFTFTAAMMAAVLIYRYTGK